MDCDTPIGTSDHSVLWLAVVIPVNVITWIDETKEYFYDFKNIDFDKLNNDLLKINIDTVLSVDSIDSVYNNIVEEVQNIVHSHAKKKWNKNTKVYGKYLRNKRSNKWMNPEILNIIDLRNVAFKRCKKNSSEENFQIYKFLRNKVVYLIRLAKKMLEISIIDKAEDNIGSLYKYIKGNNLCHPKKINKLMIEGLVVTDISLICNKLGEHFTQSKGGDKCELMFKEIDKFTDIPLSCPEEIEMLINEVKDTHTNGPDGISYYIIKRCKPFFCQFISICINCSLRYGKVPIGWKEGVIYPKFKSGNRFLADNYRGITNTNCMSKISEKFVLSKINNRIDSLALLADHQHGFRRGRSTCSNLMIGLDDWTRIRDKGKQVVILYTDFSKAFDTINISLLLNKLFLMSLDQYLVQWLKSFLTQRRIRVKIEETYSEYFEIDIGVPQGAVLSAVLFNLFVADAAKEIKASVLSYADDFKLYCEMDDLNDYREFQKDIDKFVLWSKENQLVLNSKKCVILSMGYEYKKYPLMIDGELLLWVDQHKDLGVWMDKKLNFEKHCSYTVGKVNQRMGMIRRNFNFLDLKMFKRLYKVFIEPYFDYCSTAIYFSNKGDRDQIDKCFRRCTKSVKYIANLPYKNRLGKLNMFTPLQRKIRFDLLSLYKKLLTINHGFKDFNLTQIRSNGRK